MADDDASTPSAVFWGISGIALIWNLMGFTAYWATVTLSDNDLMQMPAAERGLYENLPSWVIGAFAIAVVCGILGSLALILRRRWSLPLFVVSLLAILVQRAHTFFMTDYIEVMGAGQMALPVLIIAAAIFLVGYARYATSRGWLS